MEEDRNEDSDCNKLKLIRNKRKTTKLGATKFEERELDEEMIKFCRLMAQGHTPKEAGKILGLSDYKIRTYPDYKNIQKETEYWAEVFAQEGFQIWKQLDDKIDQEVGQWLYDAVKHEKLLKKEYREVFNLLLPMWKRKQNVVDLANKRHEKKTAETEITGTISYRTTQPRSLLEHDEPIPVTPQQIEYDEEEGEDEE